MFLRIKEQMASRIQTSIKNVKVNVIFYVIMALLVFYCNFFQWFGYRVL